MELRDTKKIHNENLHSDIKLFNDFNAMQPQVDFELE